MQSLSFRRRPRGLFSAFLMISGAGLAVFALARLAKRRALSAGPGRPVKAEFGRRPWRSGLRRRSTDSFDRVDVASDDSFPASDPPSWTPVISIGESD
jgi:hypothetical protein